MIADHVARIPCGNESGSIPNQSECVLIDMQILVGKAAPGHLGLVFDKVFDEDSESVFDPSFRYCQVIPNMASMSSIFLTALARSPAGNVDRVLRA